MALYTGTAGSELIAGTAGIADQAAIAASDEAVVLGLDALGRWTVSSTATGNDTLSSIETLRLDNASFALRSGGIQPVNASNANPDAQTDAVIAPLADGGYVVVWQSLTGGDYEIYSQRFSGAGEKLGGETHVNTTTAGLQYRPQVATLADGSYVVAWEQVGSTSDIVLQRFAASGAALGGETVVNTTTALAQSQPQIAALDGGGYVVVWQSAGQDGDSSGQRNIYSQRYDAGGTALGGETRINASVTGDQIAPQVAALADGGYVAMWQDWAASGWLAQRYDASGAAVGAGITAASYYQTSLRDLAGLAGGGFVAVWDIGAEVTMQRFDASGAALASVEIVNATQAGVQFGASVAALADGGFVVSWQSGSAIVFQRFGADGSRVGAETTVTGNGGEAVVEATADGGFALSWQVYGTFGYDLYTQRYDASGTAQLPSVTGSANGDVIAYAGTAGVRLNGGAGDDTLTGGSGDDVLDGGSGNDSLIGGAGNDLYVVGGNDAIADSSGNDTVQVSASYTLPAADIENLVLTGSAAADLTGNGLANRITGNDAANRLDGAGGADTLEGRGGDDTYFVDNAGDVVIEAADGGSDAIVSSVSQTLGAEVENLFLVGSDAIAGSGNAADNLIVGNAAGNALAGNGGADTLVGEGGDDSYSVDALDTVVEAAGEGDDTVLAGISWSLGDNLENLVLGGGSLALNGSGNALANRITGNAGNNVLDGGAGADTLDGGAGNDIYFVDTVGDVVIDNGGGVDLVKSTIGFTLGYGVENLTLLGSDSLWGGGNSGDNVLRGNAGANLLAGDYGNDTLYGNAGDDSLDGGWGSDLLIGGAGNDTLTGDYGGADSLIGGLGNDVYWVFNDSGSGIRELAGEGSDTVRATVTVGFTLGANLENLELAGGNVNGYGNALANAIVGTAGSNLLNGGAGADTLSGLGGNDSYVLDNAGDSVIEAAGAGVDAVFASVSVTLAANVENATLTGAAALAATGNELANRLVGNAGANALAGLDGDDALFGGAGNDTLLGGAGNDVLAGGAGDDSLNGGDGSDTADYRTVNGAVTVNLALTAAQATGAGNDVLAGIETVIGSSVGNDTLAGDTGANRLVGLDGDDSLIGAGGDDTLLGGDGNDVIVERRGNSVIDGGAGIDRLDYSAMAAGVAVDLARSDAQDTGAAGIDLIRNIEVLVGSAVGHDTLAGDDEDNRLEGGGGNDRLDGAGGNDSLLGGDGNDWLVSDAGDDSLDGGAGSDTADYRLAYGSVRVDLRIVGAQATGAGGSDQLAGIENLVGSDYGNDRLTGDDGANRLDGGAGNDTLAGGAGADLYVVDASGDVIVETGSLAGERDSVLATVDWTLGATLEDLTLAGSDALAGSGNALANALTGNAGANALSGLAGDDTLDGGAGRDSLSGGAGLDAFRFSSALSASTNVDRIADFVAADDRIEFDHAVFSRIGAVGALAAGAFALGAVADSGDRIVYNQSTGALYYDADGSGSAFGAVQFAALGAGTLLTAADFWVI
ncbi:beta strand repeat-containing protein [Derxia lacustris]|uniref:beta strand repeat-containing protein n=1 Tax=Derxia lacustris TaxID=764842 RepID=UPI000A16DF11|nr:calcium-binding protein [Derxia lacustris]